MADSPYMVGNAVDQFQQGQLLNQKMQTQDLANQTTAAQLPGVVGQSQSLAARGQVDQQTLPETLAATRSTLMSKMSDNDAKLMTNTGGQIAQFGAMLDGIPPPARMAAVSQYASKFGMDPNSPLIKGLAQTPPDKLPEVVKSIGSNMVQLSADYIKNQGLLAQKGQNVMAQQRMKNAGAVEVAGIRGKASLDVAGLNNASREKLAEFQANLKQQLQDTKAKSLSQFVATRAQQYQDNPTQENKDNLDQAFQLIQGAQQNPAIMKMFQDASVGQSVLPGLPNTIPQPQTNPVQSFPTKASESGPATTKQIQVGTQKGRPVYTSDPTHPEDRSKWHY